MITIILAFVIIIIIIVVVVVTVAAAAAADKNGHASWFNNFSGQYYRCPNSLQTDISRADSLRSDTSQTIVFLNVIIGDTLPHRGLTCHRQGPP